MVKTPVYDLRCSFCNKHQDEVHRLIASNPKICVCDQCIVAFNVALSKKEEPPLVPSLVITQDPSLHCSFCHRTVVEELRMISYPHINICEECIVACGNLLKGEELENK